MVMSPKILLLIASRVSIWDSQILFGATKISYLCLFICPVKVSIEKAFIFLVHCWVYTEIPTGEGGCDPYNGTSV